LVEARGQLGPGFDPNPREFGVELGRYDYRLPPELIAQEPVQRRDESRLLHLEVRTGRRGHLRFGDLAGLLGPGDVLVLNQTKVVPARLEGRKRSGGRVEVLLLQVPPGGPGSGPVECLVKGARGLKPGMEFFFELGLRARVEEAAGFGRCRISFGGLDLGWLELLNRIGRVPLPPYIKRESPPKAGSREAGRYQTVYAAQAGAVAAPTAGLHFTPELLARLEGGGVELIKVTLHVGYGTFEPLRAHHLAERRLHPEAYSVSAEAAAGLDRALREGRRLVAVGTTVVRLLEHLAGQGGFQPGEGMTDLFIRPGFKFRAVRAMVTNFHLPRTSLLMLVAALAGRETILAAYQEAVERGYRFYSFGDAMFIEA